VSHDSRVDPSLPAVRVVRILDQLIHDRATAKTAVLENGPELTSQLLDQWAHPRPLELQFIEPSKPIQIAFFEYFNRCVRDECLNAR
jgi:putative transposase